MIVVGFLLLVLCAVCVVLAIYSGGKRAEVDLGIIDFDVISSTWFFAGMLVTLLGVLGLMLMKRGVKVSRQNRKKTRELEKMRGELDKMRKVDPEPADAPEVPVKKD